MRWPCMSAARHRYALDAVPASLACASRAGAVGAAQDNAQGTDDDPEGGQGVMAVSRVKRVSALRWGKRSQAKAT